MNRPPGDFSIHGNDHPEHVFEVYRDLRATCPVAHTADYGGYWALTRYQDVRDAALDPDLFISSVQAVVPSDPRGIRRPPLNFDAPRHTPYRRALLRTLSSARVERILDSLRPRATALFREFVHGDDRDIARTFGTLLPAYAAATWLNLDERRVEWLAATATAWVDAWRAQDAEQVTQRSEEMYEVARWLVADRTTRPRDITLDPASSLLSERVEGRPLETDLVVGALRQSLVVGMVAPPLLIGAIAAHLATDTRLQDRLRRDQDSRVAAAEEYIRLFTPYRGFARTVSRETSLHDRTIQPEEPVTLVYAAANRDPDVFRDPESFVLGRANIGQHLGFGIGRHQCVGMHLARGVIGVALDTILDGSAELRLLSEPVPTRMPELGYQSVQIAVIPAYAGPR
ncbi:cytochrome P450 [Nocardia zapadnayensis]|uniref:cytochrome P450 n=1 Tax=Nocardia rhamnosiphila TaxID=426716 RepID=UPI002247EEAD|nr:cytochrome P450 [Nocardia zapadnayensis]MCX0275113.1 cytochrome P450 [Nocardia zapadnayensis]